MDKITQSVLDYLSETRLLRGLKRVLGDKVSQFVLDYVFYVVKGGVVSTPGSFSFRTDRVPSVRGLPARHRRANLHRHDQPSQRRLVLGKFNFPGRHRRRGSDHRIPRLRLPP